MNAQAKRPRGLRSELPPPEPTIVERELAYQPGATVSRTLAKASGFAFDAGQRVREQR